MVAADAALAAVDAELSGKIDNKVKVDGAAVETLNVQRIDSATYHDMVVGGTVDSNTIYIVSSDHLNAFGEQIKNVADGTEAGDAVNFGQLTQVSTDISQRITDIVAGDMSEAISDLSTQLTQKVDNLSTEHLNDIARVDDELSALDERITALDSKADGISATADTAIKAVDGKVDELSGKVEDLSGEVQGIAGDVAAISAAYPVELIDNGRVGNTVSYTLKQGGVDKGNIVVPYDVFVNNGEIVAAEEDGVKKSYLVLTLNNAENTQLSIETTDLVDVYTGEEGTTITTSVDGYKISAEVNDGAITTAKLADGAVTEAKLGADAVTTAKVKDGAITMAKLSTEDTFVFDCGGAS
jgi:phage host-nuclease inhibitor protein Gam